MSKTHSVFITSVLGTVSFENMDPFYRRGITYFGTVGLPGTFQGTSLGFFFSLFTNYPLKISRHFDCRLIIHL
jgi:hypothetical protein